MNRQAYFLEAERLSDDFSVRAKAVDDYLKTAPDLADDEAYKKLCNLQSEASAAAGRWSSHCENNRSHIRPVLSLRQIRTDSHCQANSSVRDTFSGIT